MASCVKCNAPVADNVYLCPQCQQQRVKPTSSDPPAPEVVPILTAPSMPVPTIPIAQKTPLFSRVGVLIIAALVVVFVIPGLIGALEILFVIHSASRQPDPASSPVYSRAQRTYAPPPQQHNPSPQPSLSENFRDQLHTLLAGSGLTDGDVEQMALQIVQLNRGDENRGLNMMAIIIQQHKKNQNAGVLPAINSALAGDPNAQSMVETAISASNPHMTIDDSQAFRDVAAFIMTPQTPRR